MTPNAFKALSLAAALVVAGSSQAAEFEIDFESGTTLPATDGEWTVPTGDASAVVATPTGAPNACETQVLSLDTGDDELSYAPTSTDVTILEMDVCFVGADTAPDAESFTGKTMVYLDVSDSTPLLKAYVNGAWRDITPQNVTLTDGGWYKLRMEFAGDTVTYTVDGVEGGSYTLSSGTFSPVTSVGFKGTGYVDNFVGDKATSAIETDVNGSEVTASAEVTVAGLVVDFGSQAGIQFIRVYDDLGNFVTLRTSSATATINTSKLPGNITRVDAVTSGSAIPQGTTAAADSVTVDTSTATPTIKVAVSDLVSGLYYKVVDADTGTTITSYCVTPQMDGENYTFDVPVSPDNWGVKKFKIVVSDEL